MSQALPKTINDVAVRVPRSYRNQAISASVVAATFGKHPYMSPFTLYHRMAGNIRTPGWNEGNRATEAGTDLEPFVINRWRRRNPGAQAIKVGTYANVDRPWQVGSPDRAVVDGWNDPWSIKARRGVEAKTDAGGNMDDRWGEEGTDQVPDYVRAQGLWQIDLCGFEVVDVPVMFSFTDFRLFRVERDWSDIKFLRREAWAFLERVQTRTPPPLDWLNSTSRAVRQLHPEVEDTEIVIDTVTGLAYLNAIRDKRAAEQAAAEAENAVRLAAGSAKRIYVEDDQGNRRKIASRAVFDMKERVFPACTVDKLTPPRKLV